MTSDHFIIKQLTNGEAECVRRSTATTSCPSRWQCQVRLPRSPKLQRICQREQIWKILGFSLPTQASHTLSTKRRLRGAAKPLAPPIRSPRPRPTLPSYSSELPPSSQKYRPNDLQDWIRTEEGGGFERDDALTPAGTPPTTAANSRPNHGSSRGPWARGRA